MMKTDEYHNMLNAER